MMTEKLKKNPEYIRDIVARVVKKLEATRRIIVRCSICDMIYLAKPNSEEAKHKLCEGCLRAYGHFVDDTSDHDV